MIIRNSKKILAELAGIESEISKLENYIHNEDLNIDLEKLLEDVISKYGRER